MALAFGAPLLELDPRGGGYAEEQLPNLYDELVERIEALPAVRSAIMEIKKTPSPPYGIAVLVMIGGIRRMKSMFQST